MLQHAGTLKPNYKVLNAPHESCAREKCIFARGPRENVQRGGQVPAIHCSIRRAARVASARALPAKVPARLGMCGNQRCVSVYASPSVWEHSRSAGVQSQVASDDAPSYPEEIHPRS